MLGAAEEKDAGRLREMADRGCLSCGCAQPFSCYGPLARVVRTDEVARMTTKIRPARGGKGWEYDILFRWPEGGRFRERANAPVKSKSAAER